MPARFDTTGPKELRRDLLSHAQYEPQLFIGGDPLVGFEPTYTPPKLGYWGVTTHDKQINAAMVESGNLATWVWNQVVDPLIPGDQRYVGLGPGLLMREQFKGSEPVNGWRALSRQIMPIQNVADIDRRITFEDEDFDANDATDRWLSQPANGQLLQLAKAEGFDLGGMLRDTRNLDHFVYTQNRILAHAQAMGNIRRWEDNAGLTVKWTSRVMSLVGNYLLTDPTVAPSMVLPFGWTRFAGSSISIGAKTIRLAAPITGGQRALALGRAASALSPEAVHVGLATHIGHRAAVAVEMGVYGGVFDGAIQAQRMEQSEILFDNEEYQQHFSWAEMGLAVGISALGGFVFAGRGSKNLKEIRRANAETAGGGTHSPIAHDLDATQAQTRLDTSAVRVQRAAQALLGTDAHVIGAYLDPTLLSEVGLTPIHIAEVMERLAHASGNKRLAPGAVMQVLADLFTEAGESRATRSILEQTFATEIEKTALATALNRAARANPKASNMEVLEAAKRLVPQEIEKIEAEMQRRAKRAIPAKETELEYWDDEALAIFNAAQHRNLTQAELDYVGIIRGKLVSQGWDDPFDGLTRRISERWTDGSVFSPLRARGASPISRAMSKVLNEQEAVAKASVDFVERGGAEMKRVQRNAQARLRRANKNLDKAVVDAPAAPPATPTSEAVLTVRELNKKWRADPPKTVGQRRAALEELWKASDFNASVLIEDESMMARVVGTITFGGGKWLRTIATAGTGMNQTIRSTLGMLRELAHEFDNAKLRVGDLDPTRRAVHRTLQELGNDMDQRTSVILDELARLHQAGKWGNSFLHPWKYGKARLEFDTQVIRHIADDTFTSTDSDVMRVAELWVRNAEELGELGTAAGVLPNRVKGKRFFPRRWNVGVITKDEKSFIDDLTTHFEAGWEASDDVHLDTLAAMGKAVRKLSKDGDTLEGWDVQGIKGTVKSMKRSELKALGINESDYNLALRTVDPEDGFTPLSRSAKRAAARLQGDDAYEQLPNGKIRKTRHGAPHSEADRAIEESVWSNPALHKYLDFRFANGVHGYNRSTGMRIANAARHQERWGIPGLTMEETLDFVESKLLSIPGTNITRTEWRAGITTLREKLHLAEGRLPTLRDHTNKFQEFISATANATAGVLYGSGIGQAVLSTEVAQALMSRLNMRPDVIVQRGQSIFKGLGRGAEMRANMQALGLTVRQYRLHTLERLTGGAVHSEGFQFGIIPKLLAPWGDVLDQIMGRTASSGGASLGKAGAVPAALRAWAGNMMTIGGMDYWTQFSRMLHVQSMLDETGRFFKAAERSAKALQDSAGRLDDIERKARQAVLSKAKTVTPEIETKARKAGNRARLNEWIKIVRKNGFGNNWQIAERMARAKLLDPRRLALLRKAGEETGALRDTGLFKTLDWNELNKYQSASADELAELISAKRSLRDMMVQTLHKRVSEQSFMQTPTSQTSRTWMGRVHLSMTSFARSWFDNNILDTAQMPMRAGTAMLGMYLLGETMNRTMRDIWKGRDLDDIMADAKADPDNYIARTLTNIPLLGQYGMLARPAADALTLNGRMQRVDTGESAAEGAFGSMTNVLFDSVHALSPFAEDSEIQQNTWRQAARWLPGYRTWWAMLGAQGIEAVTGVDIPGKIEGGGRYRSYGAQSFALPEIPEPRLDQEINIGPKFPEDLSFTYTQE